MSDALCDIHDRRDARGQCSCSLIVKELRAEVEKLRFILDAIQVAREGEEDALIRLRAECERLRRADEMDHRGVLVDKLHAELERIRPVYEAAKAWRCDPQSDHQDIEHAFALADAVDAALVSEAKETR